MVKPPKRRKLHSLTYDVEIELPMVVVESVSRDKSGKETSRKPIMVLIDKSHPNFGKSKVTRIRRVRKTKRK